MIVKFIMMFTFLTLGLFYILAMISMISSGKAFGKLFHKLLGWHLPNKDIELSGINQVSTCKYCGKKIIKCHLDWFADDFSDC